MMIHGMMYQRPVRLGEIIGFESRIVLAGRSRLVALIEMKSGEETIVRGFVTFVHVDRDGKPLAHELTITAETPEEVALQELARKVSYEGKGK